MNPPEDQILQPDSPIGVFDSGIGGLTVVRQLINLLPQENIIYFGDTARVPYGNKSQDVVREYAVQDTRFLLSKKVKIIVVACNTASAVAMDVVSARSTVPAIGVIEPTARKAVKLSGTRGVGVIGTLSTINSCAYSTALMSLGKNISVMAQACPLFVPLAEEGLFDHPATNIIASDYLSQFVGKIDVMILGCTHYPLLRDAIARVLGSEVKLVDAGEATAKAVKELLSLTKMLNQQKSKPRYEFYVSDFPQKFNEIAERFLGRKLEFARKVQVYSDGIIAPQ
ncbi:MAG TPA: glutamate racemase [Candidatus Acidoferrales bacterium]|nr:glutamate racemase [Candidatus Acidoferrales bacterium]